MPWPVNKNAPVPSTADYTPRNVAPLITFFVPIVNAVLGDTFAETPGVGSTLTKNNLMFRYENNTPDDPTDDIKVMHPHAIGDLEYEEPPLPTKKSDELKSYERVAKKSKRLRDYMRSSPAGIDYFK